MDETRLGELIECVQEQLNELDCDLTGLSYAEQAAKAQRFYLREEVLQDVLGILKRWNDYHGDE